MVRDRIARDKFSPQLVLDRDKTVRDGMVRKSIVRYGDRIVRKVRDRIVRDWIAADRLARDMTVIGWLEIG